MRVGPAYHKRADGISDLVHINSCTQGRKSKPRVDTDSKKFRGKFSGTRCGKKRERLLCTLGDGLLISVALTVRDVTDVTNKVLGWDSSCTYLLFDDV